MTPEELESREAEVLAAMGWLGHEHGGHSTDVVARCLSLYQRRDCPWCPLLPPGKRQPARGVPPASRELVRRLLVGLQAKGRVAVVRDPHGKTLWVVGDSIPQNANLRSADGPVAHRPAGTRAARPGWSFAAGPKAGA